MKSAGLSNAATHFHGQTARSRASLQDAALSHVPKTREDATSNHVTNVLGNSDQTDRHFLEFIGAGVAANHFTADTDFLAGLTNRQVNHLADFQNPLRVPW